VELVFHLGAFFNPIRFFVVTPKMSKRPLPTVTDEYLPPRLGRNGPENRGAQPGLSGNVSCTAYGANHGRTLACGHSTLTESGAETAGRDQQRRCRKNQSRVTHSISLAPWLLRKDGKF
jgi:hypothetical protein